MSKAAPDWTTCPAEILHLIFRSLSPADHQSLCLVNRKFQTVAEPLLYSKVHFTWQKVVERRAASQKLESPPPITQLLRTLLSEPQLAAHIKSLKLDGHVWRLNVTFRKIPKINIPEDQLGNMITFIRRTGVPYMDWWSRELRDGSVDALIALLLLQLPHLRHLHLDLAFTRQTELIGTVLRSAIFEPGAYQLGFFQHLRELSFICHENTDVGRDMKTKNTADILPCFYLPNVQHMSASIHNPNKWGWPIPQVPAPSKLESLELYIIREGYLGEILAVTKNLRTLRWRWYYYSGARDEVVSETVDLDQIGAALSHAQGTLVDLIITADSQPGYATGDHMPPALRVVGSLIALRNFDQIKTLHIPLAFMVGFAQDMTKQLQDVIPQNVEFLTITSDLALQNCDYLEPEWPLWEWKAYAVLGLLESWLSDWARWTPHLRRVTLSIHWGEVDWQGSPLQVREQLGNLSARTGVLIEFVVEKTEYC